MLDRLTKFNTETGEYEYRERAKTQEEFNAQRKAVIQRLGELEDRAEGEWIDAHTDTLYRLKCSLCGNVRIGKYTNYCCNCGAKMKGKKR